MNPEQQFLTAQRTHDYKDLIRRWRKIARPAGLRVQSFIIQAGFDLALNLHEDYDGQCVYIYELTRQPPHLAEHLLESVAHIIPPDGRRTIDISRAKNGVIRRKIKLGEFDDFGLPEAIYLHFHHSDATMTIETPSEFSLFDRILAQSEAIQAAIDATNGRELRKFD